MWDENSLRRKNKAIVNLKTGRCDNIVKAEIYVVETSSFEISVALFFLLALISCCAVLSRLFESSCTVVERWIESLFFFFQFSHSY